MPAKESSPCNDHWIQVVGTLMMAFIIYLLCTSTQCLLYLIGLGMGYHGGLGMVHLWCDFIDTSHKSSKMIIEPIPTALWSASVGIGIFLAYVGIKNAGFFGMIDPHTYTVVGEGADMGMQRSQLMICCLDWLILTTVPLVILVKSCDYHFLCCQRIKGGLSFLS